MFDQGHNGPPEDAELFKEAIADLASRADQMAAEGVSDANAGDARDIIGLATKLAKDIDAKRKEVKQPHLDASREIDGTYNPLVSEAKDSVKALKDALRDFVIEQERKAAEARAEAERKAAEEAAKAEAFEDDPLLGDQSAQAAKEAEAEARMVAAESKQSSSVKGSEGFRAASLRTKREAVVTDWKALVNHYADHPDMQALAERLANADIRHAKGRPVSIAGVEVKEERVLA